eukprot:5610666-Pleurochrysis_carterae.AAC.1
MGMAGTAESCLSLVALGLEHANNRNRSVQARDLESFHSKLDVFPSAHPQRCICFHRDAHAFTEMLMRSQRCSCIHRDAHAFTEMLMQAP